MDDLTPEQKSAVVNASKLLQSGHLVAIPTETVYGLAAPINNQDALKKIFLTKERPFFDPLIVHVCSTEEAKKYVSDWPLAAEVLSHHFWPGPLTIVLPKNNLISDLITSGLPSVGLRCPAHTLTLALIEDCKIPLAAPSANKFGKTSPTSADHVAEEFKNEDVSILDGGPCEVGIESTVLSLKPNPNSSIWSYSILRPGFISLKQIQEALTAHNVAAHHEPSISKQESPGHMKHHYMPKKPLVIIKDKQLSTDQIANIFNQKILDLPDSIEGVKIEKPKKNVLHLAELKLSSDPTLAARTLYSELRLLSENPNHDLIYYFLNTEQLQHDLWTSILERLTKAAILII